MSRPTGPDDPTYGGEGSYGVLTTGAPAWDGNLSALSDDDLTERINSLGAHIGNLHTAWDFGPVYEHVWRPATSTELRDGDLPRWVTARVAALAEQERRWTEAKTPGPREQRTAAATW